MAEITPIYKAINACLTASPVPATSGDIAAAVIRAAVEQLLPPQPAGADSCCDLHLQLARSRFLDLATLLDGKEPS